MSDACGLPVPSCQELSSTVSTVEHAVVLLAIAGTGVGVVATLVCHAGAAVRWVRYRWQVSRTIAEVESVLAAAARHRPS